MNICEYIKAKKELAGMKKTLSRLNRRSPKYKKAFQKYIELLIAVKGHAWCMDVKTERKKMARLLSNSLEKSGLPVFNNISH